eukprot:1028185-Alexandrium_andersonii.AAC.1
MPTCPRSPTTAPRPPPCWAQLRPVNPRRCCSRNASVWQPLVPRHRPRHLRAASGTSCPHPLSLRRSALPPRCALSPRRARRSGLL